MLADRERPIRYSCPHCRALLEARPSDANSQRPCAACGKVHAIPLESNGPAAASATAITTEGTRPAFDAELPPRATEPPPHAAGESSGTPVRPGTNLMFCMDCGGRVSRRAIACPHCGCPVQELLRHRDHRENRIDRDEHDEHVPQGHIAFQHMQPGSLLAILITIFLPVGEVLAFLGGVILANARHDAQAIPGALLDFAGIGLFIAGVVMYLIWLSQTWSLVARDDGPTPATAPGFLFIPFFNCYWIFRVVPGLSTALQRELRVRDPHGAPGAGWGVGLAACIVALIPYINLLAVVLFVVWLNLANAAKNRLLRIGKARHYLRDPWDE
jgi:hypothetical protein